MRGVKVSLFLQLVLSLSTKSFFLLPVTQILRVLAVDDDDYEDVQDLDDFHDEYHSTISESGGMRSTNPDERFCVWDDDEDAQNKDARYTCQTREEHAVAEQASGRRYNLGVQQRIDGSATERQAIRDVLTGMTDYFANHVMVEPEYRHVRTKW